MFVRIFFVVITVSFVNGFPNRHQNECHCGHRNVYPAARIVGGKPAAHGELPWRVPIAIIDKTDSGALCGGTIINQHWILSAAHCKYNPGDKFYVYYPHIKNPTLNYANGDLLLNVSPSQIIDHPEYNNETFDNDIRLIYSPNEIQFSEWVNPVCLPWNFKNWDFSGLEVLASGWGTTGIVELNEENQGPATNDLLEVTLPVLSSKDCVKMEPTVTENKICTFNPGHDTCQGDSGGSIDYEYNGRYYAIGITSYGRTCGGKLPGVYTKITKYLDWIEKITRVPAEAPSYYQSFGYFCKG